MAPEATPSIAAPLTLRQDTRPAARPCVICGRPTTATVTLQCQWSAASGLRTLPEPLLEPLCPANKRGDCRTRYGTDGAVRRRHAALFAAAAWKD